MDLVWYMIFGMCAMNAVASSCPENCLCKPNKILCQGFSIKEFPQSIPPNTSTLLITNTSIQSLKPADFETFAESLTAFAAKDSKIAKVEPHTFNQTHNLFALGFSGTMLTSLPKDLFQNLQALSTLTLSNRSSATISFHPSCSSENIRPKQKPSNLSARRCFSAFRKAGTAHVAEKLNQKAFQQYFLRTQ